MPGASPLQSGQQGGPDEEHGREGGLDLGGARALLQRGSWTGESDRGQNLPASALSVSRYPSQQ